MSIYVNKNPDTTPTKKYFGNYLGIVIQNNDPEKSGKVKVWVPHISPTIYKNWDEKNEDKAFKFIGRNIDSDITDIVEDLKKVLPWAESASPIIGAAAPGKYNAHEQQATISDSNRAATAYPHWEEEGDQKYKLNNTDKAINKNLMLHSYQIRFKINDKKYTYTALLPDYFKKLLKIKRLRVPNY